MSKVFYLSLIALMSLLVGSGLPIYQFYQFTLHHPASFLLTEFWVLHFMYVGIALIVSMLFFIYRFNQHVVWPIICTITQIVYLTYVYMTLYGFYSNPVGFFESKENLWNSQPADQTYAASERYHCCGFRLANFNGECRYALPCARAISKTLSHDLMEEAYTHITMCQVHIISMIAIWFTHLMGGIEFDQAPRHVPVHNKAEYNQLAPCIQTEPDEL
jgi:hypothetical protein